ncbi:MAG: RsmE family RNA methyltransferase [Patescibacteria group bacterium]|nr:RsmE family RNA methyltransferase [Patescibacteria group bacterium]
MKIHRFIGQYNLKPGNFELKDAEILHQMFKVLSLKPGEKVVLCDGQGQEAVGTIAKLGPDKALLLLDKPTIVATEPKRQIVLYCAVLKRENFDWVVQKATEVGVTAIIPIITQRTVKQNLNLERLLKIAKEAAEQSSRGKIPTVSQPIAWSAALELAQGNDVSLFFDIKAEATIMESIQGKNHIGIFIGPEGGWDPKEIQAAKSHNFITSSLGLLTLRAETAAIVASYLACSAPFC